MSIKGWEKFMTFTFLLKKENFLKNTCYVCTILYAYVISVSLRRVLLKKRTCLLLTLMKFQQILQDRQQQRFNALMVCANFKFSKQTTTKNPYIRRLIKKPSPLSDYNFHVTM